VRDGDPAVANERLAAEQTLFSSLAEVLRLVRERLDWWTAAGDDGSSAARSLARTLRRIEDEAYHAYAAALRLGLAPVLASGEEEALWQGPEETPPDIDWWQEEEREARLSLRLADPDVRPLRHRAKGSGTFRNRAHYYEVVVSAMVSRLEQTGGRSRLTQEEMVPAIARSQRRDRTLKNPEVRQLRRWCATYQLSWKTLQDEAWRRYLAEHPGRIGPGAARTSTARIGSPSDESADGADGPT
jgi:hypothetical protein